MFNLIEDDKYIQFNENQKIPTGKPIVIIGANGSGKSSMGVKIKENLDSKCHRIGALRNLTILESYEDRPVLNTAETKFNTQNRQDNNHFAISSDYTQLIQLLYARNASENRIFEQVREIWNYFFENLDIVFDPNSPEIKVKHDDNEFNARNLSDGQREILYIIAKTLVLDQNNILIIDEPELHLHKSLRDTFWDRLEAERPDLTFIYITHDLDFARSRADATFVWVKSVTYKNSNIESFDYEILEKDTISEDLTLELLGTRKNVLLIEGNSSSLDINLYKHLFPELQVKAHNNCRNIIDSVPSLNKNNECHHLKIYGLIDRDYHSDKYIEILKKKNIFTIEVAFVENLYLVPEILEIICDRLSINKEEKINKAINTAFEYLELNKDVQIIDRTHSKIREELKKFKKNESKVDLKKEVLKEDLDKHMESVKSQFSNIYDENKKLYEDIIRDKKINRDECYKCLLKFYKSKGLLKEMSPHFFHKDNNIVKFINNSLARGGTELKQKIIDAMKNYMPQELYQIQPLLIKNNISG